MKQLGAIKNFRAIKRSCATCRYLICVDDGVFECRRDGGVDYGDGGQQGYVCDGWAKDIGSRKRYEEVGDE